MSQRRTDDRYVRNAVREGLDVEAVLRQVAMSLSLSSPLILPQRSLSWLPIARIRSHSRVIRGEANFVTDRDGRILLSNPVAQQLVGRHQDVIGSVFHEVGGMPFLKGGKPSSLSIGTHRTNREVTRYLPSMDPSRWYRD